LNVLLPNDLADLLSSPQACFVECFSKKRALIAPLTVALQR
jgi:hypothetical protein